MNVVSFVAAASNSGKTTLIEKVVKILTSQGLRVAVIKHASTGFDLDLRGKDSWRFREAGAYAVMIMGPDSMALMKRVEREPVLPELAQMLPEADIVIQEGFKKDAVNKIEVFRSCVSGDRPLCMDDASYLALVSDELFAVSIPRFDLNDAEGVAEFIVKKFIP